MPVQANTVCCQHEVFDIFQSDEPLDAFRSAQIPPQGSSLLQPAYPLPPRTCTHHIHGISMSSMSVLFLNLVWYDFFSLLQLATINKENWPQTNYNWWQETPDGFVHLGFRGTSLWISRYSDFGLVIGINDVANNVLDCAATLPTKPIDLTVSPLSCIVKEKFVWVLGPQCKVLRCRRLVANEG